MKLVKNAKQCFLISVLAAIVALVLIGTMTYIIDPYCHYRASEDRKIITAFANERYIHDGIIRYFDYDAIMIGTSMTENFKTSEFDELFQVNSVKVPFSGASYKEINDMLMKAVSYNDDIKVVVRCLDYNRLLDPADYMYYSESDYPMYLYNENLFDDVNYLWNKELIIRELDHVKNLLLGIPDTIGFDEYARWQDNYEFGKAAVDANYVRAEQSAEIACMSEKDYKNEYENLTSNVIQLAEEHPEIEFYLFFSPYSIYCWDSLNQSGNIERQLEAEKYAIEMLVEYDNIHLYSFFNEYDMICNLDNYKDSGHYGADVNTQILIWMRDHYGELTRENYEEYCRKEREFYLNFDYDSLF